VRQAGAVRRISVAVLVDGITTAGAGGDPVWEPRPEEELKALRDLVVAAIGFDEARGDVVTIESMEFQPAPTPGALVEAAPLQRFFERNAMTLIQISVLTLVVLALGLTVVRPILTRRSPTLTAIESVAGVEAEAGGPIHAEQIARQNQPGLPAPESGDPPQTPDGEALRVAVAEQTEQTVAMLQEWLAPAELPVKQETAT